MLKDDNFFVLTKENIENLSNGTYIYGYILLEDGSLYNNCYIKEKINKREVIHSAYTMIEKDSENTVISTDEFGFGMIFLYNRDGEWVVSNSLFRLFNYLIEKNISLTLNEEFIYTYYGINEIATINYDQTILNEISLLPGDQYIVIKDDTINILSNPFKRLINFNDDSCLAYIDNWINKWVGIIRSLYQANSQLSFGLSGGFDSRLTLALFLESGIDLNSIYVESAQGAKVDFAIASSIADHYKFKLNQHNKFTTKYLTPRQVFKLTNDTRFCQHKEFYGASRMKYFEEPFFLFTGFACTRGWYNNSEAQFIEDNIKNAHYPKDDKFVQSVHSFMNDAFGKVYARLGQQVQKGYNFMNFVYNFTRGRFNFGSNVIASATMNQILLNPILDLHCINPIYENNSDFNIIYSYIWHRLSKDLLKFPFDRKRKIATDTIKKAETINENRGPFVQNDKATQFRYYTDLSCPNEEPDGFKAQNEIIRVLEEAKTRHADKIPQDYLKLSMEQYITKTKRHPETNAYALYTLSYVLDRV